MTVCLQPCSILSCHKMNSFRTLGIPELNASSKAPTNGELLHPIFLYLGTMWPLLIPHCSGGFWMFHMDFDNFLINIDILTDE